MYEIQAGTPAQTVYLAIHNSDGTDKTDLLFNTAGFSVSYARHRAAPAAIALVELAAPGSGYASGGFRNVVGNVYRLDLPDAAIAAGVPFVVLHWSGGGTKAGGLLIKLPGYDPLAVGASVGDTADAVRAELEGAGTMLERLHSDASTARLAALDKLLVLLVDNVGQVTTSNPGGGLSEAEGTALAEAVSSATQAANNAALAAESAALAAEAATATADAVTAGLSVGLTADARATLRDQLVPAIIAGLRTAEPWREAAFDGPYDVRTWNVFDTDGVTLLGSREVRTARDDGRVVFFGPFLPVGG